MLFDRVRIRLVSSDIPGRMAHINAMGVPLENVHTVDDLTVSFTLSGKDYPRVKAYLTQKGDRVKRVSLAGPGRLLSRLRQHWLVSAALVILLALTLWLPGRVLFIQVEGNDTVPIGQVLEAAEKSGIYFGARVSQVRSERVKNRLLQAIPQLQWVGVNTRGCVATVTVAPRQVTGQPSEGTEIASILSCADAIVTEITVTQGNALCKSGDVVRRGQVLISGYTDCGLKIQASSAQGEVFGQTIYARQTYFPSEYMRKARLLKKNRNIFLQIGKKEINLSKGSGIPGTICDKMYQRYYLTLPGGFRLPVAIAVESCEYWAPEPWAFPQTQAADLLRAGTEAFLTAGMISGQVLSRQYQVEDLGDRYCLTGHYICREMIGRIHPEKIGEAYEQSNGKNGQRGSG